MQSFSPRIWTRVAVSISYDDNHYTIGTSITYQALDELVGNRSTRKNLLGEEYLGK